MGKYFLDKKILASFLFFLLLTDGVNARAATLPIGEKFRGLIERFLPEGYDLDWQNGEIDFSLSGVKFKSRNLCLSQKDTKNRLCFEKSKISLRISKFQVDPGGSSLALSGGVLSWSVEQSKKSQGP